MNCTRAIVCLALFLAFGGMTRASGAEENQAKPNFALRDADGVARRLSDYRGKWVVLEWISFDCAPVTEHYQAPARTMQTLQQAYKAKGVIWLSINSTAAGHRSYVGAQRSKTALARLGGSPTALLLDPQGTAGKTFGAQVTPEIRVVSPRGDVVYSGGVEGAGAAKGVPYLAPVLNAALAGQPVPFAAKPAQGCRVHYAPSPAPSTQQPVQPAPGAQRPAPTAQGPQAPNFTLMDSSGATRRLSDYRGKWVILEWVNYDCPFVKKHYHSSHRNMQSLQSQAARQGIVWLSICSSARGKQGFFSSAQANARMRGLGASPTAYLHDPTGAVGRSYGARTTPDMRIISPQGAIVYAGGIDSIRSARASDVGHAKNYVALALADIIGRRPIAIKRSAPYGCSVKY